MNQERIFHLLIAVVLLTSVLGVVGCAKVPADVVKLSDTLGQDLDNLRGSYKELIKKHFDGLRFQANTFIDTRWKPVYLKKFIETGGLIEAVRNPDPEMVLLSVDVWAQVAIEEIEAKRKTLVDPIDADEKELTKSVDEAFDQLARANATITAHLNSVREVQAVQDKALEAVGLKELRDKINTGLADASVKAEALIKKLKKTEEVVDEVEEKKQKLKDKIKGDDNDAD